MLTFSNTCQEDLVSLTRLGYAIFSNRVSLLCLSSARTLGSSLPVKGASALCFLAQAAIHVRPCRGAASSCQTGVSASFWRDLQFDLSQEFGLCKSNSLATRYTSHESVLSSSQSRCGQPMLWMSHSLNSEGTKWGSAAER